MDADVIVIGTGPVGCTAARVSAAAGLRTLVLARGSAPSGTARARARILPPGAAAHLARVFELGGVPPELGVARTEFRAYFHRLSGHRLSGGRARTVNAADVAGVRSSVRPSWLEYRRLTVLAERPVAYTAELPLLEPYLSRLTRAAGAAHLAGAEVLEVVGDGDWVRVTVRDSAGDGGPSRPALVRTLRSRFAVVAGGGASPGAVTAAAEQVVHRPVLRCLYLFLPAGKDRQGLGLDLHFGLVRGGYGWAFAGGGGLTLGVSFLCQGGGGPEDYGPGAGGPGEGGLRDRPGVPRADAAAGGRDVDRALAWLCSLYGPAFRGPGAGVPSEPSSETLVAVGGGGASWNRGRVLVVGEGAESVDPLSAWGMGPAIAAAEKAARAVVEAVRREEAGGVFAAALGYGEGDRTERRAEGRLGAALGGSTGGLSPRSFLFGLAAEGLAFLPTRAQRPLVGRTVLARLAAVMARTL